MKNKVLFLVVAVLLMAGSCGAAVAQTIKVQVTNPSGTDRKDVPVVVDLKNVLGKKTAGVVSAMVTTPSLIGRAGGESFIPAPPPASKLHPDSRGHSRWWWSQDSR